MSVDAGTIYSEVRVELAKLNGDVQSVVASFDKIVNESQRATAQVAQSWDKVQTSISNIDKTYQGLKGTYDTVGQKQQALLATIRDLIDKGISPENQRVMALKQQYNELQEQSDKTKAAHESQREKLDNLKTAYGAIVAAVTAAIGFSKKLVDAWAESEQAATRLAAAVKISGNFEGMSSELKSYADELRVTSGFEDELLANLMSQAVLMGRNKEETKSLALAATQLANAGITSVDDAFTSLSITYEGMAPRNKVLKAMIGDLTEEQLRNGEAVQVMIDKTAGMNEMMMKTTAGGLKGMKNAFGELAEASGRVLAFLIGWSFNPIANLINRLAEVVDGTMKLRAAQVAVKEGTATAEQQILTYNAALKENALQIAEVSQKQNDWVDVFGEGIMTTSAFKALQNQLIELQKVRGTMQGMLQTTKDKMKADEEAAAKAAKTAAEESARQKALADLIAARKKATDDYNAAIAQSQTLYNNEVIDAKGLLEQQVTATETLIQALVALGYKGVDGIRDVNGALSQGDQAFIDATANLELLRSTLENYGNESDTLNQAAESQKAWNDAFAAQINALQKAADNEYDSTVDAMQLAEEYRKKLEQLDSTKQDGIEADKRRAIEEVQLSAASDDAKAEAIKAIEEYYAKLKDTSAYEEQRREIRKTIDDITSLVDSALSAIGDLISSSYDAQIEALKTAYEAQVESFGDTSSELSAQYDALVAMGDEEKAATVKAQMEKAEAVEKYSALSLETLKELHADALAMGDEETAAELEEAEKRKQAELDYNREVANVEYQKDMASWNNEWLMALVNAAAAIIKLYAEMDPVSATGWAIAEGIITGIQIAAIVAAKPTAPSFATGGIVLPSGSGGTLVNVAENGSPELLLNGGSEGQKMLDLVAGAIADKIAAAQGGTLTAQFVLDGQVISEFVTQASFDGRILIAKGKVV